jgi:hypothetical protein
MLNSKAIATNQEIQNKTLEELLTEVNAMAEYLVELIKTDDERDNTNQNPESAR